MNFEQIFAHAKKAIMKDGNLKPFIVVQTRDDQYQFPAPDEVWQGDNFDTVDKGIALLVCGRGFAQTSGETKDTVQAVYLASEMWIVRRAKNDPRRGKAVRTQPDRREAVGVMKLQIVDHSFKQSLHTAGVIRHGAIVDLVPGMVTANYQSPLLPSFYAGICSTPDDDATFLAQFQNLKEEKEDSNQEKEGN